MRRVLERYDILVHTCAHSDKRAGVVSLSHEVTTKNVLDDVLSETPYGSLEYNVVIKCYQVLLYIVNSPSASILYEAATI